MPDRSLGRCHACGIHLSSVRLTALLRRRELARLLDRTPDATQYELARSLSAMGFVCSRVTVTKDLRLIVEGLERAAYNPGGELT